MNWYLDALANYAVFKGRSSRRAYWFFLLFSMLITVVFSLVMGVLAALFKAPDAAQTVIDLYLLASLVPMLSCGARRMHDTGRSGWWIIVPIVGLIFACGPSDVHENKYGPRPDIDYY